MPLLLAPLKADDEALRIRSAYPLCAPALRARSAYPLCVPALRARSAHPLCAPTLCTNSARPLCGHSEGYGKPCLVNLAMRAHHAALRSRPLQRVRRWVFWPKRRDRGGARIRRTLYTPLGEPAGDGAVAAGGPGKAPVRVAGGSGGLDPREVREGMKGGRGR